MALKGIRVVEMAGLAPVPLCGMILRDFGADVIRIDRPGPSLDTLGRGKQSLALNLKRPGATEVVRRLCATADVLVEPFRPGVMEKLGLGPDALLAANPRLVYARLTGFGQHGPYASMAGHDINYVALSGLLSMFGRREAAPQAPQNVMADFAGGATICALGIVMALLERHSSGLGQVIDASMVEGAAYVGSWLFKSRDLPVWSGAGRGTNWFDGGSHFYETYETKDGRFVAVGALEPQFYAQLVAVLEEAGLRDLPEHFPDDVDDARRRLAAAFRSKTRDEWQELFDGRDACVVPVLELDEAAEHRHNAARGSFVRGTDGRAEPVPAPRLSRTPGAVAASVGAGPEIGAHSVQVLRRFGFSDAEVDDLLAAGVVHQASTAKL